MTDTSEQLSAIKDIKQMMERSSRFISLSGWSGISAGICALIGAALVQKEITRSRYDAGNESGHIELDYSHDATMPGTDFLANKLFLIAVVTFVAAFISSFIFTYIRSKKNNTPIWGTTAKRLLTNISIPLVAGGLFLLKLLSIGVFGLLAPGCLLFYGLALLNASKYTLREIRYLGYLEIILGIVSCWFPAWGLYFWTVGFGVLHIVYGIVMLNKYERPGKDLGR